MLSNRSEERKYKYKLQNRLKINYQVKLKGKDILNIYKLGNQTLFQDI